MLTAQARLGSLLSMRPDLHALADDSRSAVCIDGICRMLHHCHSSADTCKAPRPHRIKGHYVPGANYWCASHKAKLGYFLLWKCGRLMALLGYTTSSDKERSIQETSRWQNMTLSSKQSILIQHIYADAGRGAAAACAGLSRAAEPSGPGMGGRRRAAGRRRRGDARPLVGRHRR